MGKNVKDQIDEIKNISTWKRGSNRAVHKPLLLLLSLAAILRGDERLTSYKNIKEQLEQLLRDFGPPRQSTHPEYPFWRLQNDGEFWEIPEKELAIKARGERIRTGDVPSSVLLDINARGGFRKALYKQLCKEPQTAVDMVKTILEEHFPHSIHLSLLNAVGMPPVPELTSKAKRDPEFRSEVIRLYEHRCAMCGFDGRLGNSDIALEAAHIMWHAHGGPDHPTNGILLCTLHHQALDRGAVGLTNNHHIIVSQHLYGGVQVMNLITGLGGKSLGMPLDPAAIPAANYIEWHRDQVFRDPVRPVSEE
ncbi:MAG: HNH endonuclease [Gammaproteobacteria bacterium]|nr:HNH endonuclease [Gammaproteobacteria bacterium]